MAQDPNPIDPHAELQSGRLMIQMLAQFLIAVRYRKNVVIIAMVFVSLLGGLYYATATRYYRAKAGLLMMQAGMDSANTSMTGQLSQQRNLMKTFENVVRSPTVIEAALSRLPRQDLIDLADVPKQRRVAAAQRNVSATIIPTTNIIEVGFVSKDPVVAVNVVNALVEAYLDFLDKTHKGTTGEISRVLTKERVELARQLQEKQNELVKARSYFGDLGTGEGGEVLNPVIKRAIFFTDQLNQVQRRRIELQASLATIQSAIRNGEDLQQHLITVADVVGKELLLRSFGLSSMDTRTQASLEETLLADRAELQAMQGRLGEAHPEMAAKREKIRLTEAFLQDYQKRSAESVAQLQNSQLGPMLVEMVQQKLTETMRQETSLQAQFETSRAEAVALNGQLAAVEVLEHDVQRLRDLGDVLVKQISSIDLQQDGQDVRAAVIDQPVPIDRPISPRRAHVILLVLFGGLGAGLMAVYVLDILDDRFRSVEDLQRQLGVSVLSMIRQLKVSQATGLDSLQLHVAPAAAESEAFRTLRTALALADEHLSRIVVTSSEPGDGKTTVLANLGVCYAQSGKKTLLIDADLRRPGLTNLMQMRQFEGLSSILRTDTPIGDAATALIRTSGIDTLDVLPCGVRPTNPAELLAGGRLTELIDWAATVYDQILIDSPPALATSDAAVIGRRGDGVVMVVQPGKNRRRAVIRAVDGLLSLKIPLLGLVLNRVGSDSDHGYYGYGTGYDYSYGYGAGYGHEEDDAQSAGESRSEDDGPTHEDDLLPSPRDAASARIIPRRAA